MSEITDIVLMNIVFWSVWGCISYMPQMFMQKIINTY